MNTTKKEIIEYLNKIDLVDNFKIKKLRKGDNNNVFLIKTKNKEKYILKKNRTDISVENRLLNECAVLKFLNNQGINFVPKIIYYDENNKVLIMSYIEGRLCSLKKLKRNQIAKFIKQMVQINSLKYEDYLNFCKLNKFPNPKIESDEIMFRKYTTKPAEYIRKNCKDKKIVDWVERKIIDVNKITEKGKLKECFSHGDITSNIIVNKNNIYFIDWELARFVESRRDITGMGYSISLEKIKNKVISIFVHEYAKYEKAAPKELKEGINIAVKINLINHALWAIQRYTELKLKNVKSWKKYYKKSLKRIKRCDKLFNAYEKL